MLLDPQGYVCQGSGENMFIVSDGELHTPDLSARRAERHHARHDHHVRERARHSGPRAADHARRGLHRRRSVLHRHRGRGDADPRTRQPHDRRGFARPGDHASCRRCSSTRSTAASREEGLADEGVTMSEANAMAPVVVKPADLPVFCPNPAMPLWSSHPRVFLDIADEGEAMCPYCGTRYVLEGGPRPGALNRTRNWRRSPTALAADASADVRDRARDPRRRVDARRDFRVCASMSPSLSRGYPQCSPHGRRTHPDRRAVVGRRRHPVRAAGRAAARPVRRSDRRRAGAFVVRAGLCAHARHPPDHRDPVRARQVRSRRAAQARARTARRRLYACVRAAQLLEVRAGAVPRAHSQAHRLSRRSALRPADRRAAGSTRRRCRGSSTASPRSPCRAARWCRCRRRRCWCRTPPIARARCARCTSRPTGRSSSCAPARNSARPSAGRRTSSPNWPRCSCATGCRCGSSARPTTRSPPTPC